jgi:uroporphyrinogen-III synthase
MQAKIVAILETRVGAHLAELIARKGAVPLHAPALEEVPDIEPPAVAALLGEWHANPFKMAIFQTGVGTRGLFQAADASGSTRELLELLETAIVVVRGPKPVGELNARQVRIDVRAASPFTTETVLEAIASVPLDGSRVLVQRYGESNRRLAEGLASRGAAVHEIATYRWALPQDTNPLRALIDALAAGRVDAVVFTSAVQVKNLDTIAVSMQQTLAELLKGLIVASIGPVCSRTLAQHGIDPSFEADPPKLGPLLAALEAALA